MNNSNQLDRLVLTLATPHSTWACKTNSAVADESADPAHALQEWHDTHFGRLDEVLARWVGAHAGESVLRVTPPGVPPAAGDSGLIDTDVRVCESIDVLLEQWPDAQVLLVIQSPASTLACALARGESQIDRVLQEWIAAASRLTGLVQRMAGRVMVIDWDAAVRQPEQVQALLQAHHGLVVAADRLQPVLPGPLDLDRAVANAVVAGCEPANRRYAELCLTCPPELTVELANGQFWWFPIQATFDGPGAVAELTGLRTAFRDGEATKAAAAAVVQDVVASHQSAPAELAEPTTAADPTEPAVMDGATTGGIAGSGHEAVAMPAGGGELRSAPALTTVLVPDPAHASKLEQAEHEVARLRASLVASRADLAEARDDVRLYQLQLRMAQDELRHQVATSVTQAVARPEAAPIDTVTGLEVGLVSPLGVRNAGPHRELSVQLRKVRRADRALPDFSVRLVEHNGHAGLVLFQVPGAPPPLVAWQESGRESGRAFMLLVPSDWSASGRYPAFTTTDLDMLHAIAAIMSRHVASRAADLAAFWPLIARRLGQELRDLPPAFRADSVAWDLQAAGAPGTRHVQAVSSFANTDHAGRRWASMRLRWQPGAALHFLMPADAAGPCDPPLLEWTQQEQGALASEQLVARRGDAGRWEITLTHPSDLRMLEALLVSLDQEPQPAVWGAAVPTEVREMVAQLHEATRALRESGSKWRRGLRVLIKGQ